LRAALVSNILGENNGKYATQDDSLSRYVALENTFNRSKAI
jgi:hypothetical protein